MLSAGEGSGPSGPYNSSELATPDVFLMETASLRNIDSVPSLWHKHIQVRDTTYHTDVSDSEKAHLLCRVDGTITKPSEEWVGGSPLTLHNAAVL